MKPIFQIAKKAPAERKRIVFAKVKKNGTARRASYSDEKIATPILIGRPAVLQFRIEKYGFTYQADVDFENYQS